MVILKKKYVNGLTKSLKSMLKEIPIKLKNIYEN